MVRVGSADSDAHVALADGLGNGSAHAEEEADLGFAGRVHVVTEDEAAGGVYALAVPFARLAFAWPGHRGRAGTRGYLREYGRPRGVLLPQPALTPSVRVVRSYAIEEVVLPLPGHAVEYPRHGVGAAAYAAALADDGISEERLRAVDCPELEVLRTEWCEEGLHAAVARL